MEIKIKLTGTEATMLLAALNTAIEQYGNLSKEAYDEMNHQGFGEFHRKKVSTQKIRNLIASAIKRSDRNE